jgi:DNA-binding transcriptional LysR family regulator
MDARLERLAADLAQAWRSDGRIALPASGAGPASRAEAFATQDRMAELIADSTVGWKVGAAVKAVQELEGHDGPIIGRMLGERLYHSPAEVPAATFAGGKVECEFAFRLTADLPPQQAPRAGLADMRLEGAEPLMALDRRVLLEVPSPLSVALVVSQSDLVGVLGRRLAEALAAQLGLKILPLPIKLPLFPAYLVWHRSRDADPGHRWLRQGIKEIFGKL